MLSLNYKKNHLVQAFDLLIAGKKEFYLKGGCGNIISFRQESIFLQKKSREYQIVNHQDPC
jgi:hypothetical protein